MGFQRIRQLNFMFGSPYYRCMNKYEVTKKNLMWSAKKKQKFQGYLIQLKSYDNNYDLIIAISNT